MRGWRKRQGWDYEEGRDRMCKRTSDAGFLLHHHQKITTSPTLNAGRSCLLSSHITVSSMHDGNSRDISAIQSFADRVTTQGLPPRFLGQQWLSSLDRLCSLRSAISRARPSRTNVLEITSISAPSRTRCRLGRTAPDHRLSRYEHPKPSLFLSSR